MKNIIISSHKFLTQPDDDLVLFLNENKYNNVLHIRHSFSDAPDRRSLATWYKEGVIYKEFKTSDFKNWPEIFIYIKEFIVTIKWILKSGLIWDKFIGMDGLCVLFGNFLRFFGKIKTTVYWAMDFVPENRFNEGLKNKIYHWINIQGYKKSDEMWDLSPRMAEAREKFLNIKKSDYKFHRVVPYGVWLDRIKRYDYDHCEKNTLVFMGHLLEKQGVQLVIRIIPEIIKIIPNFKFKIIGGGNYKDNLVKLAIELNVLEFCDFKGKIEDIKILEQEIAKSCIAIAPYIKELDTWTYYADPGKVKTYLACGVPVLLTDIPWNAKDIKNRKCGLIINEDSEDLINKILFLMDIKDNQEFRNNSLVYSKTFDYNNIFSNLSL